MDTKSIPSVSGGGKVFVAHPVRTGGLLLEQRIIKDRFTQLEQQLQSARTTAAIWLCTNTRSKAAKQALQRSSGIMQNFHTASDPFLWMPLESCRDYLRGVQGLGIF